MHRFLLLSATLLGGHGLAAAEPIAESFADAASLGRLSISGDVTHDTARSAKADGSGSLRIGPKGQVIFPLRDDDGSGAVSFSIYEDGAKPEDPKARASGATWGVRQSDGIALMSGAFYAPYLSGADSYALSNASPSESPFGFVRYLGIKRSEGWHTWTFTFDADKGLTITCDGSEITSKRFDWHESRQAGFNALVFSGDGSSAQGNLWIDDITVTLGGPMKIAPKAKVEAAKIVPDTDPAVEGAVVTMRKELLGVHPRLLFGPEDVPKLKAFYASDLAADLRKELEDYLGACVPPKEAAFLTDATDGQRQGYWRMPTVALHYVLTGDKASFDKAVGYIRLLLSLPEWESKGEVNSGMSAANIMIGAGLTLDWLWHDLDPELREAFRAKCLYHARAMYHGGHLRKAAKVHYWQADPGNNHRWHRNAGLAACLFAAATGADDEAWIMTMFKQEMDFIIKWLPPDGTSHESPGYMTFGISHLIVGTQIVDHCLGTTHLQHPFFKNVPRFVTQALTPDYQHTFNYGDQGGIGIGKLNYDLSLYKCTSVHGLKNEQAALDRIRAAKGAGWGWMGLVWYNPDLAGGDADARPVSDFFEDVGVLFARDGWKEDGKGVLFKCGPFGGHTLNHFRNSNNFSYINVAHDDPDANTFLLYGNNRYLVESDRYSETKKSANHNTILINGTGQLVAGRPEGGVWWQPPTAPVDMNSLSFITAVKLGESFDVIEGEAGPLYIAITNTKFGSERPALERFRRALAFAKGSYVLVLDDIRAPSPVEISWLVQSPDLQAVADQARAYRLINKDVACPFRIETDRNDTVEWKIVDSPADTKGKKLLGWKQLRAVTTSDRLVTASAYDLYGKTVDVRLDVSDPAKIVAIVTHAGVEDRWEWVPAADPTVAYQLTGTRGGEALVSMSDKDTPKP